MTTHHRLLIRNASVIARVCSHGERVKTGASMRDAEELRDASIVVGVDGRIEYVGAEADRVQQFAGHTYELEIDATGKSVIPGLVDAHTHPVWCGDRVHEFAMKLAGATYLDIHKSGGGIGFTVNHVRNASEDTLLALLEKRLSRMMKHGTVLAECKSGYGLDAETEVKMLRVLRQAEKKHPIEIECTFLGAHSIPKGSTMEEATKDVIEKQLPRVKELNESGEIRVSMIDVFQEQGVFDAKHSRMIMEAGKEIGLGINFHGDELHYTGAAEAAASLGALAVSHCELISDEGIRALAEKKVVATLLPLTAYVLRIEYPPARKMIDHGVPVAIGSDFNPNCHALSVPFAMNVSCVNMRMTMEESLVAATINAAASIGRADTHGSIEIGKTGSFVILDAPHWHHIVYQMVDPPIEHVIIQGKKVV